MFVPLISSSSNSKRSSLGRRKGGGGGGKGGGSSGGSSGGKSGSSGSSSGGSTSSVPLSGGSAGGKTSATSYGSGGGKTTTIGSGSLFAGRTQGGGSRGQVFGTSAYGSGYPGVAGRGVAGRGFPFYFWPVVWGGGLGYGGAYLHDNEYGRSDNSSRPGGIECQANFASNSVSNNTFHVLADNSTVTSLISSINSNCSSYLSSSNSSTAPIAFNENSTTSPRPESAIQYYRASSVVLTLDGYNNTAALSDNNSTADTPLPTNIDNNLRDCLNQTIGLAVPLIDGAHTRWSAPSVGALGLVWIAWWYISNII